MAIKRYKINASAGQIVASRNNTGVGTVIEADEHIAAAFVALGDLSEVDASDEVPTAPAPAQGDLLDIAAPADDAAPAADDATAAPAKTGRGKKAATDEGV